MSSFVDPAEEEAKERAKELAKNPEKKKPEQEYVIPKLLREIKEAVESGNAQVAHQLCRIADALSKKKETPKSAPAPAPEKKPEAPVEKKEPTPTPTSDDLSKVRDSFTAEQQEMLRFTDEGDHIKIATRKFLGSDNFAKIASIVRNLGGEYISAGKNSHFKVKKK